jgi:hypothetical protein
MAQQLTVWSGNTLTAVLPSSTCQADSSVLSINAVRVSTGSSIRKETMNSTAFFTKENGSRRVPSGVTRRRRLSTLSLCCAGFLVSLALVTMLGGPCHHLRKPASKRCPRRRSGRSTAKPGAPTGAPGVHAKPRAMGIRGTRWSCRAYAPSKIRSCLRGRKMRNTHRISLWQDTPALR